MTSRCVPVLCAVLLSVVVVPDAALGQGAPSEQCDRDCLRTFITSYLDALVAHNPATLAVSKNVKFTEDTMTLPLGEGLWKTASRLRTYRQDFLDTQAGVAGAHVVIEEGTSPVLLALRLKIVNRQINEVETMVVRSRAEGVIFDPDAFKTATTAMNLVPEKSQLPTRDEAIRIAQLYPSGLKAGSFVRAKVPFAPDASRFENGRLMAGRGCTSVPGCNTIKTQKIPTLRAITPRLAAVDEDLGIVWLRLDFGLGSVPGSTTTKLIVWEAFKVYGGQIHAVEALMETVPMASGSGWD